MSNASMTRLRRLQRAAVFFFFLGVLILFIRIVSAEGSVHQAGIRWESEEPPLGIKQTEAYTAATTLVDGNYEKGKVIGFVRLVDFALSNGIDLVMPFGVEFLDLKGREFIYAGRIRTHLLMPKSYRNQRPLNSKVLIQQVPPLRVAYIRFRGSYNIDNSLRYYQKLLSWMADRGYQPTGAPRQFYFDHPFWKLPWFLRCEIEIPIQSEYARVVEWQTR